MRFFKVVRRFRKTIHAALALAIGLNPSLIAWTNSTLSNAAFAAEAPSSLASNTSSKLLDLTYVPPEAVAAIFIQPKQLLSRPELKSLPLEVLQAASLKEVGIDLLEIKKLTLVIEPPVAGPPGGAIIMESAVPIDLDMIKILAEGSPGEIEGKEALISENPMMPSGVQINDTTVILGTQPFLSKLVAHSWDTKTASPLLNRLRKVPVGQCDLYVAVDLKTLQPLIQMGMMAATQDPNFPKEARPFLQIPNLLRFVEGVFTLSGKMSKYNGLVIHANNAADADTLEGLVKKGFALVQQKAREEMEKQGPSKDPVEQAMQQYAKRISKSTALSLLPERKGNKLIFFRPKEGEQAGLSRIAIIGVLVALLLPAVKASRGAALRASSQNTLKTLGLAILNYESAYNRLPAQANYDPQGKPLLSWRVHILPFIEENHLYKQFHLNEPWDSEHNIKLVSQMPVLYYAHAIPEHLQSEGKTVYLAPISKDSAIAISGKGNGIRDITDGMSNTILLVEADASHAVIWTKPADLKVDSENPHNGLGHLYPNGIFNTIFCDGSSHAISNSVDSKALNALFTKAGDE